MIKKDVKLSCFSASIFLGMVFCGVLNGCSSGVATPIEEQAFEYPDQFQDEGVTWLISSESTEEDLQQLTGYFQQNPSMAEGTLVEGEPTIFANAKGTRRYYWIRQGADQPEWLYIQIKGSKSSYRDGKGVPFPN